MHRLCFGVGLLLLGACASTTITESPKTAYVAETGAPKAPEIIWTSRGMTRPFDYLGLVESRSWTYKGALERLIEGGQQLRADAIVDIHYEPVGFLDTMQAFAIKFKE
ncbi:MAG: hypothetical protein KDD51_05545 [Bdellovibrionales bacterium]|nr:hypothetical protein [Bdellovibrionales bacterium]